MSRGFITNRNEENRNNGSEKIQATMGQIIEINSIDSNLLV